MTPVVLRKGEPKTCCGGASRAHAGNTYLALYGLGNVRDERLYRSFTEKRVQMMQPQLEGDADLFSVLMLHQNRAQHTPKGHVSELMLPDFLDFVIWGHEHECLVQPQLVAGRQFYVTQPGSSVATSLVEAEVKVLLFCFVLFCFVLFISIMQDKHVMILEINRGQFQTRNVKLETVRPFVMEDISLSIEGVCALWGDHNIRPQRNAT